MSTATIEERVLDAAARHDRRAFLRAARELGGIEKAQQLVRTQGERTRVTAERPTVTTAGARSVSPAPGRYKVVFSESARRDLDHALDAWDGHEVGGALVGHIDGDTIHVSHVGTQAVDRHRSTVRTEIPVEHCEALADAVGADWLGDWHTHDRGEGTPSSGDETAWAGLRNSYGRDAWLGLILTPGPDPNWPMCDPRLHAWTVSERGLNATTIETRRSPWAA